MAALAHSTELRKLMSDDRSDRKRSLQHFTKVLFTNKDSLAKLNSNDELSTFFTATLTSPLMERYCDEAEKVRELSLALTEKFVKQCSTHNFTPFLTLFVPVFKARLSLPYEEKSEEVRLLLVNLMLALLSHETISSAPDSVSSTIANCLQDNFPEVKRQCCLVIVKLCKKSPDAVKIHSEKLLKALTANSSHQHSKTRQMSIKAIGFVCVAGAPDNFEELMREVVLPCFKKSSFDRVPSVRKALITGAIGKLAAIGVEGGAEILKTYETFLPNFLSFFLLGVSDGTPEVEEISFTELTKIADLWDAKPENPDANNDSSSSSSPSNISTTDKTNKINKLFSAHFTPILNPLLEESSHWTAQQRHRSLESLEKLINFAKDTNVMNNIHASEIIKSLSFSIRDDEKIVRQVAVQCAAKLGEVGDISSTLEILLPRLDGSISGMDTPEKLTGSLLILASVFKGCDPKLLAGESGSILKTLASATILESDSQNVLDALFEVVENFVKGAGAVGGVETKSDGRNAIRCCIQLLGVGEGNMLFAPAYALVERIATIKKLGGGVEELLDVYFVELVELIKSQRGLQRVVEGDAEGGDEENDASDSWMASDSRLTAFEALVRTSGCVAARHFGSIIDVFEKHMNERIETAVRVKMMAMLESILNSHKEESCAVLQEHSSRLINKVICPSLIWKAGGPASTVRKVTIACLYTLLKSTDAVSKQTLFGVAPKLLPPLKSNLGDYDASTRQLVCYILKFMFVALPGALGEEPVHQLYPELLKCLDDSSDEVRYAVCGTLKAFLLAAPVNNFKGTLFDYLVDQLLIHLDDPDIEIQKAVLEILVVAFRIDKNIIQKKTEVARGCHRDTVMCDLLLKQLSLD